ncbi:MAG: CPBP family intramembrane metalloprotease [Kiritimatiellaeota bacterium]|nr:CPBP family intramembrane metalloprotease [Kiritimatiellota bacterium]
MKTPRTTSGWRAAGALAWLLPAGLALGVLTALLLVQLAPALPDTWCQALLRKGPETVTRRCLQIWAVLLLPLLLRRAGWRGWRDIGWRAEAAADSRGAGWRDALRGGALGLLTLGSLALFAWLRGGRIPSPLEPGTSAPLTLLGYAVSGLAVAVLEETVARGMLFRLWARVWGWVAAAVVSSVLFGLVHFVGPARAAFDQTTGAATAWSVLQSTVVQIPDVPHFGLRLLNLTLLGLVLCAMVWHTRTVWLAVGAHAAWVWCIKASDLLTDPAPLRPWSLWWGVRADATDSLASTFLMLGLLILFAALARRRPTPEAGCPVPVAAGQPAEAPIRMFDVL